MTQTLSRPRRRRRASRLSTAWQLLGAFRGTGRWWLTPLVVVLLVVAVTLVAVQVAQYAAPFVYTLF
jgi:hypothetical protein